MPDSTAMAVIDSDYVTRILLRLLNTASPTGFTDHVVHVVGEELEALGIAFEITRRGAMRANLPGRVASPDRSIVGHLDTLGALVKDLKPNGRLAIVSIGTWSARFAEGARVTVFTDHAAHRGTILPLKASGHTYNDEIDTQPVSWDNLEVRIDEPVRDRKDLIDLGFNIGDFIAVDTVPEILPNGFINSRHLDDKAGVAAMLGAAKAIVDRKATLPLDCHLLMTISEEVGSGASSVLHQDVAEMVSVDNGTVAPGQNSQETGVTVAMADSSGPFDYHLTRRMIDLCRENGISHQRDVFRYYRCDSASAVEAGNDIRTALVCFGIDASHGYERTHMNSILSVASLLYHYMQSPPLFERDKEAIGPLEDFPDTASDWEDPATVALTP
ncbi:osmoprotectant NAGGN system M42 family peptidase [Inquilinus sp. CAU 1745]|uniref:osmoprotectant NAGGN system M42 family peptidase n=1 Tax=Inquilinus sp. CAU 1745 TaxID=3140369 RepID=UPI00325B71D7